MKETFLKLYRKYRELVAYFFVGCATTLLNLIIFALFNAVLGDKLYLISNVISWIISVTFAFFMYKLAVFRSMDMRIKTLLVEGFEFYGARLLTLVIESLGLFLLIDVARLSQIGFRFIINITGEMIAKFIMLVVVTILNYIFSKFVIFRKKK